MVEGKGCDYRKIVDGEARCGAPIRSQGARQEDGRLRAFWYDVNPTQRRYKFDYNWRQYFAMCNAPDVAAEQDCRQELDRQDDELLRKPTGRN